MGHARARPRIGLVIVVGALASCSQTSQSDPADGGAEESGGEGTFLPFATSFADFRSWPHFHSEGPPVGSVPTEFLGPREQYINKIPPKGSTEFPVGTIIVDVLPNSKPMLARAKRGPGYNVGGAEGWEWFELLEFTPVQIKWRGKGPPSGEIYGGDPNACNGCHSAYKANDYVASKVLQLSNF